MKISATWHKPLTLISADDGYNLDLIQVPVEPAAYIFARRWGDKAIPLYIGKSNDLRGRVKAHLNSRKLMKALRPGRGERCLIWCTFHLRQKQTIKRVLDITERGLIQKSLADGHRLVNVKGVRTPTHAVLFNGNLEARNISSKGMFVQKHWREFA